MIQLKGIKRNTPAGLSEDGELEEAINLRYKDGAWRPVPERTSLFGDTILPYTNVFIHSNSGYKHYLGLKSNGEFEYFAQDVDGTPEELETPQPITTLITPTFTQLGNVININDNGLKHLIWYESSYILIDANFDGEQTTTELIGKVDLKVSRKGTATERDVAMYYSDGYHHGAYNYDLNSAEAITQNGVAKGLFSKALKLESEEGNLHGFVLACTAIELYDGSYILHSNPVLLGQSLDAFTRYEDTFNYITNKATFVDTALVDETATVTDGVGQSLATPATFTNDTENKCYTGKSNKQYRGTANQGTGGLTLDAAEHEAPNLYAQLVQAESTGSSYIYATITANELQFKVNSNIHETLKPLIKSVSVFISPEISIYKNETSKFIGACYFGYYGSIRYKSYNWQPEIKTNAEIIKELSELKNFYKVHEIPFEDINAGDWTTIDLEGKLGDSLLTQEALTLDNFTHHQTLPEVQFMYNSKLHVLNYKTALSRGWPYEYFECKEVGMGQFPTVIAPVTTAGYPHWWAEVKIKTVTGTSVVVRHKGTQHGTWERNTYAYTPMLSYPDSRATEITLYIARFTQNGTSGFNKSTFKLTAHPAGNFAYYISPDLKPITYGITGTPSAVNPTEVQRELIYQNSLKVSEVNNPFTFPLANTYQIGNGQGLAMAVNTIALSTGQFGQWPLYVFCSDGIYGLSVGGAEINYGTITPVSREVCNNPQSVKSIDAGVIFTTIKGVMILAGSDVQELSEALRGPYFDIDTLKLYKQALSHSKLTQLYDERTNETLLDFMDNVVVGLNYKENEVWFTNPDKTFSYVFSKGVWFKVKQSGQRFVDDYPNQYLLKDGKLIDIGSETGTYNEVTFLTRPLKLGQENFKGMLTSIIRGQINVENTSSESGTVKRYAGIHVYGSYDGKRWAFLGGNERNGELNSFGTQVERTDCKFFKIAFYGNVNINSTIDYLLTEGKQSILSNKER